MIEALHVWADLTGAFDRDFGRAMIPRPIAREGPQIEGIELLG
jgi:hypothetical protein